MDRFVLAEPKHLEKWLQCSKHWYHMLMNEYYTFHSSSNYFFFSKHSGNFTVNHFLEEVVFKNSFSLSIEKTLFENYPLILTLYVSEQRSNQFYLKTRSFPIDTRHHKPRSFPILSQRVKGLLPVFIAHLRVHKASRLILRA